MKREHIPADTVPALTRYTLNKEELADAVVRWLYSMHGHDIRNGPSCRIKVNVNSELPVTLTVHHESPDAGAMKG